MSKVGSSSLQASGKGHNYQIDIDQMTLKTKGYTHEGKDQEREPGPKQQYQRKPENLSIKGSKPRHITPTPTRDKLAQVYPTNVLRAQHQTNVYN